MMEAIANPEKSSIVSDVTRFFARFFQNYKSEDYLGKNETQSSVEKTEPVKVISETVAPIPGLLNQIAISANTSSAKEKTAGEEGKVNAISENSSPFKTPVINNALVEAEAVSSNKGDGDGGDKGGKNNQQGNNNSDSSQEPILTLSDYLKFDFVRGLAFGFRDGVKEFYKGIVKATKFLVEGLKKVVDFIKDGIESLIKPLFSLDTAQEANTSRNLEKYMQAQYTNLQRLDPSKSAELASRSMLNLEQATAEFGLNADEQRGVARAATTITPEIARRNGLDQENLIRLIAQAQATSNDLSGGAGIQISEIINKIMTNNLTSEEANAAFDDPILSRMVDSSKNRSIQGNPVADLNNLIQVISELGQEVDLGSVTETNPQRLLAKFKADLFNPRTGAFGFLKQFDMKEAIGGADVSTTLLNEMTGLLSSLTIFISDLVVSISEAFGDSSGLTPIQALGSIFNRLSGFIQTIDVDGLVSNFSGLFVALGKLVNADSINGIAAVLTKIAGVFASVGKSVSQNGFLINGILYAIAYKLGGLPLMFGKMGFDATGGSLKASVLVAILGTFGTTLAARIGFEVMRGFMARTIAGQVGGLIPVRGLGSAIAPGVAGAAGRTAVASGVTNTVGGAVAGTASTVASGGIFSRVLTRSATAAAASTAATQAATVGTAGLASGAAATGASLTFFGVLLTGLGVFFAGLALGTGVAIAAMMLMGKSFPSILRDMGEGAKMFGRRILSFGDSLRRFYRVGEFNGTDRGVTSASIRANNAATGRQDVSLKDNATGEDIQKILGEGSVQTNYSGDAEKVTSLIGSITNAVNTENTNKPTNSSTFLSTLNSSETVLNQNQLKTIPNAIANNISNSRFNLPNSLNQTNAANKATPVFVSANPINKGQQTDTKIMNIKISPSIVIHAAKGMDENAIANAVLKRIDEAFSKETNKYFA